MASTEIVYEMKKKVGRPRSVGEDGPATAISVRLPVDVVAELEVMAAEKGMRRSDVLRDLVIRAIRRRNK